MLNGKIIVLGVTGGIAAYKSVELLRLLIKAGADVHVIMTRSAQEFVTPLTFQTLSRNPVHTELFSLFGVREIGHIALADRADLFIIAPATANVIGKLANGIADDMLTTTVMATRGAVLLAPAMNVNMYLNSIYKENEEKLRRHGYLFVDPVKGELACGWEGEGKLQNPEIIFDEVLKALTPSDLAGERFLVTAGPTREEVDPVRYLSNHSSGKMGYAIAKAAWRRGAQVTLVSGPTALAAPWGVEFVSVESAGEMYDAVMSRVESSSVVIKAAAVADYRPVLRSGEKIKKQGDIMTLELVKNRDILTELGKEKKGIVLVGFAAETSELFANARKKLTEKNVDLLVANDVTEDGAGFSVDTNIVRLMYRDGRVESPGLLSKEAVANLILTRVGELLRDKE